MTQTLKPRPVRSHNKSTSQGQRMTKPGTIYVDKTVIKKKTTEQTSTPRTKSTPSLAKPYVQSHLSDIVLIEREALLNDFKNRMEINNREIGYVWGDFKTVLTKVKELTNA